MRRAWLLVALLVSGPLLGGVADKSVTVTPNPAVFRQGDTVSFQVTVTNQGPDLDRFGPSLFTIHYLSRPVAATCFYGVAVLEPAPGSGVLPGYLLSLGTMELAAGETRVCEFTVEAKFVGRDQVTVRSEVSQLGNVDPTPANPLFVYTVYAPDVPVPTLSMLGMTLLAIAVLFIGFAQVFAPVTTSTPSRLSRRRR
jgi:hypothetical protein